VSWIEPIFDRTIADVNEAIRILKEWKRTGETNTYDLKGCFNVSDMNRIEGNIRYLSDTLSDLYYFSEVETKTWNISGLPNVDDINRLIENTRAIILSICDDAPELPTTLLSYTDVNCLEQNLYKLKTMLDGMTASFLECDTFECGEG
jgi:hypothetical protein